MSNLTLVRREKEGEDRLPLPEDIVTGVGVFLLSAFRGDCCTSIEA